MINVKKITLGQDMSNGMIGIIQDIDQNTRVTIYLCTERSINSGLSDICDKMFGELSEKFKR